MNLTLNNKHARITAIGLACGAFAMLAGCSANSNGSSGNNGDGSITGGGPTSTIIRNDGTTPTSITDNGTALTGNFICTKSAQSLGTGVTTAVGTNGLIGGSLTTLLNSLGGNSATTLLNSVTAPNNVIDGNLDTYATYTLTVGLLGGSIDTEDLSVLAPTGTTVPSGGFAVFGVTFPGGTVSLGLLNQIEVATYLGNTLQESNAKSQSQLSLLGSGVTPNALFIGLKTTKSYDRVTLSLTPQVISADVGNALFADELCVDGKLQ